MADTYGRGNTGFCRARDGKSDVAASAVANAHPNDHGNRLRKLAVVHTVREIIHGVAILDYGQSGFNFPHPVEDLVVVREHPSPHSG